MGYNDQLFWGTIPDVRHLHPFGCLAYALIQKETNPKPFEPRAKPCIFLGVSPKHDAWLLLDLKTRHEFVSRDVSFFDNVYPLRQQQQTFTNNNNISNDNNNNNNNNNQNKITPNYNLRSKITTPTPTTTTTTTTTPTTPTTPTTLTTPTTPTTPTTITTTTTTPEPTTPERTNDQEEPITPTLDFIFVCDNDELSEILDVKHLNNPKIINELFLAEQTNVDVEPKTMTEARNGPERIPWTGALEAEYKGLDRMKVFRKPTPEEWQQYRTGKHKVFNNHNILKKKRNEMGRVVRYKNRLVLEGQHMKKGIHFDKTFSPCANLEIIRLITIIAANQGWTISHADVPNAYLHGRTDRLIFTRVPIYWNEIIGEDLGEDGDIVVLDGTLYGAPHAGRQWNIVIDTDLKKQGFICLATEPALYYHPIEGTIIILYVDDLFITGPNMQHRETTSKHLRKKFQIREDEEVHHALGIRFQRLQNGSYFLSQTAYIDQILHDFPNTPTQRTAIQQNTQPTKDQCPKTEEEKEEMSKIPYRKFLGKLLYLMLGTRPDIAFAVSALSRFANDPGKPHWTLMKKLLGYIKGTRNYGLLYKRKGLPLELEAMSDASFNGSYCHRSWIAFAVGINGSIWSWKSHVSKSFPDSPPMAETLAAHQCLHTILWARSIFNHINIPINKPIPLHTDSQTMMKIMKEPRSSTKSRHFEPKFFTILNHQYQGDIQLQYVNTKEIPVDALTKALDRTTFEKHRPNLNVLPNPIEEN